MQLELLGSSFDIGFGLPSGNRQQERHHPALEWDVPLAALRGPRPPLNLFRQASVKSGEGFRVLRDRAKRALAKKASKGFSGYPMATVAFYGPTDRKATKLVVGIMAYEDAQAEPMRKWYSDTDLRNDPQILEDALGFIRDQAAKSVVMLDRIIGCPHEEGIDYPEGEPCPRCPFWGKRDRWSGEAEH